VVQGDPQKDLKVVNVAETWKGKGK